MAAMPAMDSEPAAMFCGDNAGDFGVSALKTYSDALAVFFDIESPIPEIELLENDFGTNDATRDDWLGSLLIGGLRIDDILYYMLL
jgi:hypothetical protein